MVGRDESGQWHHRLCQAGVLGATPSLQASRPRILGTMPQAGGIAGEGAETGIQPPGLGLPSPLFGGGLRQKGRRTKTCDRARMGGFFFSFFFF